MSVNPFDETTYHPDLRFGFEYLSPDGFAFNRRLGE
jgi:hypothetical protein